MACQHIVERPLLNLSPGGAFQEPADEGNPQAVDEIGAKHLPPSEEDEEIGDELPHIGGNEGGPALVVGNTPDNDPKDTSAVQGEARYQIKRPSTRLI